ncbi:MAG TPA: proton-conducting transporter membrane subunit [Candidatus Cloacimonadota bacterium]|nr:proton-conducting transporter membrane subunit [Candidatus Cloacimonadota bacterium]
MTYFSLWLFPIIASLLSFSLRNKSLNRFLVLTHSLLHLGFGLALLVPQTGFAAWFGADSYAQIFFLVTAILYAAAAFYPLTGHNALSPKQSSIYTICLMAFVASMDSANLSQNLGLIWVFVETTTLASAMLISFEHHKQSLEAAWKYLFICSIGIALAFVGILLLLVAQDSHPSLLLSQVTSGIGSISPFWLKLSFVFMLIGFGTKAGFAPMHFWLPDAHSEAPAQISALLSGALLNTALLPLIRMKGLMTAAGEGTLASQLFLGLGILSVFIAAVFIIKITNYKRMLAYSSIENMGIILIAFALGKAAETAGLIHVMGHSLAKATLFLTAGNLYKIFGEKDYSKCSSLLSRHPASAWLWILGFVFIIGLPPSPLFISEFYIAIGLLSSANYLVLGFWIVLLAVIAYGLGKAVLNITMGGKENRVKLPLMSYLPGYLLLLTAITVPVIVLKLLSN